MRTSIRPRQRVYKIYPARVCLIAIRREHIFIRAIIRKDKHKRVARVTVTTAAARRAAVEPDGGIAGIPQVAVQAQARIARPLQVTPATVVMTAIAQETQPTTLRDQGATRAEGLGEVAQPQETDAIDDVYRLLRRCCSREYPCRSIPKYDSCHERPTSH